MANNILVSIEDINEELFSKYPEEFLKFAKENDIVCPNISSRNGKALAVMLNTPGKYWNRETTEEFVKKFNIQTKDSIQLFNKHAQRGILCSLEKNKYYIPLPYNTTNKNKMRKDFKFDGSEEEKVKAINNIKDHIKSNYIDVPCEEWQLGHKNPDSTDSSNENLVLQPPIQAKYRDRYIFIDTLTKISTPKTFLSELPGEFPSALHV